VTSTKPYLIRAIHQWAQDNGFTPHILVDANRDGIAVPSGVVHDGRVTLNIHPQAVQGLELGDDWLLFSARFSGRAYNVEIPVDAVLAIYARENGQGIAFPATEEDSPPDSPSPSPPTPPHLRVVK